MRGAGGFELVKPKTLPKSALNSAIKATQSLREPSLPPKQQPTAALPPLTAFRQFDTCRLIPSRFAQLEDSVLQGIAQDARHLQDLFDLDNATNQIGRASCRERV